MHPPSTPDRRKTAVLPAGPRPAPRSREPERSSDSEPEIQALTQAIHQQLGHATPMALLSEDEAAQVLHTNPRTLQNWRYAGTKEGLRWVRIGGKACYRTRELAAYILACTQGTGA